MTQVGVSGAHSACVTNLVVLVRRPEIDTAVVAAVDILNRLRIEFAGSDCVNNK